mmetsp:Transcript_88411/g.268116  ORF Transcript_88411/g.268116 Transcript_88411/m.268116 type:complete len:242 (+) Transcript_88411:205-930(+)
MSSMPHHFPVPRSPIPWLPPHLCVPVASHPADAASTTARTALPLDGLPGSCWAPAAGLLTAGTASGPRAPLPGPFALRCLLRLPTPPLPRPGCPSGPPLRRQAPSFLARSPPLWGGLAGLPLPGPWPLRPLRRGALALAALRLGPRGLPRPPRPSRQASSPLRLAGALGLCAGHLEGVRPELPDPPRQLRAIRAELREEALGFGGGRRAVQTRRIQAPTNFAGPCTAEERALRTSGCPEAP